MGTTNEELVNKAVITADALASSGKLNPEQSDKFIDYVVDETVLKNNARIVKFKPETLEIDKIGIGSRAAVPKAEASDPGIRRSISTSKVTLEPKEIMVPVEIGDTFKEINIEGESVEDHIIQMFAKQLANDLEELYIKGDTLGEATLQSNIIDGGDSSNEVKDTFLALQNGWARISDSGHIVDVAGQTIGTKVFSQMIRALPTKWRRNKNDLRWFMSPDMWELYIEKLATRATALGDQAAGGMGHKPLGITPVPVPLMDFMPRVVEHVTLTGTTAVSLRYKPISDVVVHPAALANTPTPKYTVVTDYTLDTTLGTIAGTGTGAITSGDVVKVTYDANPQMILTHMSNFIVGIGRDIRIEKDRDIYKGVNQYAITTKVAVQFEETDAIAKATNIASEV